MRTILVTVDADWIEGDDMKVWIYEVRFRRWDNGYEFTEYFGSREAAHESAKERSWLNLLDMELVEKELGEESAPESY